MQHQFIINEYDFEDCCNSHLQHKRCTCIICGIMFVSINVRCNLSPAKAKVRRGGG